MRARRSQPRRGLTLVEVAIAIVIAGIVSLIARRLFETATSTASALERDATIQRSSWESWIALRELAWHAWTPGLDSIALVGDARRTSFHTKCLSGGGWQERCRVTIALADSAGQCSLSLATSVGYRVVRKTASRCRMLYLIDAVEGGRWTATWTLRNSLPMALGIVEGPDTTIVRLGPPA